MENHSIDFGGKGSSMEEEEGSFVVVLDCQMVAVVRHPEEGAAKIGHLRVGGWRFLGVVES